MSTHLHLLLALAAAVAPCGASASEGRPTPRLAYNLVSEAATRVQIARERVTEVGRGLDALPALRALNRWQAPAHCLERAFPALFAARHQVLTAEQDAAAVLLDVLPELKAGVLHALDEKGEIMKFRLALADAEQLSLHAEALARAVELLASPPSRPALREQIARGQAGPLWFAGLVRIYRRLEDVSPSLPDRGSASGAGGIAKDKVVQRAVAAACQGLDSADLEAAVRQVTTWGGPPPPEVEVVLRVAEDLTPYAYLLPEQTEEP